MFFGDDCEVFKCSFFVQDGVYVVVVSSIVFGNVLLEQVVENGRGCYIVFVGDVFLLEGSFEGLVDVLFVGKGEGQVQVVYYQFGGIEVGVQCLLFFVCNKCSK